MRVIDPETLQRQALDDIDESDEEPAEGTKRKAHEKAKQRQSNDAQMED